MVFLKSILWLLIVLCFHRIIGFVRALYNWKSHMMLLRTKKLTGMEVASLVAMLIWLVRLVVEVTLRPSPSYFGLTGTPIDAASFVVRNRFRDWMAHRERTDEQFAAMLRERRVHILEDELVDPTLQSRLYTRHPKIETEFVRLLSLSQSLRLNDRRQAYILYGEDALNCQVFEAKPQISSWQMLMLAAPRVLLSYGITLAIIGWVTYFVRKARWRPISVIILLCLLGYESYEWLTSESLYIFLGWWSAGECTLTRWEQLDLLRNTVMAVLLGLIFLVDVPRGEEDKALQTLLGSAREVLEASLVKLQIARLARMATLTDDTLRTHLRRQEVLIEQRKQTLFNDPRYQATMAEIFHQSRNVGDQMDRISKESRRAIDQFFADNDDDESSTSVEKDKEI